MTTYVEQAHDAHDDHEHHDSGKQTVLGFWFYLMTDCILFATAFAAYAVLFRNVAEGVSGKEIFELPYVLVETAALLLSSITYGFAMIAGHKGNKSAVLGWLAVTFLFGAAFIGLEINEFHHLIAEGHGPQKSAFLSAFFGLVGLHGLHVTAGLLWMGVMMLEVAKTGLTGRAMTRLNCLSLFWHFLDIVWICVFTVVYLKGAM
ncbi:cytochrome o ubiquinol oxidase subunit III [Chromobacterium subtsugae]|uniref:Cytochrome bo(3) ubiquinol oxidase subunit 3 n=1 Tax=Chromobacterium subtsugae TaxID=251747 RepID=A0ABS7FI58_9NEIS|nr:MULTISPECIES: cytochrome o ubiquinol oxidase subunit III [Chromobacterium]KUM04015.1 cytochrome o ubiquinol oxidase subunit III [Chromobacterium subtsugae]KZE86475.1 cytochrome o ubiquinol oxidase subunit III [Chromobacterium sp. F49]MBW7567743.1 cytochrome o ubiquinol oxidase subunit III [Chromobacterium subtsugae]MBW8288969.1 cytochrome o ubiquinol oxidase subunit III [Chromobacterium subtsugae]OBU85657.1 cytochrome o ubiquinol oxidase subunit III [Chromobacterium subtsugae]